MKKINHEKRNRYSDREVDFYEKASPFGIQRNVDKFDTKFPVCPQCKKEWLSVEANIYHKMGFCSRNCFVKHPMVKITCD